MSPVDLERAALERNDRYLLEFVEALGLCPFARGCRQGGKLHREVLRLTSAEVDPVVERVFALEDRPKGEVDVALLLFPDLPLEARPFEHFVSDVRRVCEQKATEADRALQYFMVGFHPELKLDLLNPDRAVGFLRRSPDPTIQLVSMAATDRAREGAGNPSELSRIIAEAGLRAVLEAGPERLAKLLEEIRGHHR